MPDELKSISLPVGTLVEVYEPNYKTRTVGILLSARSTGHYYNTVELSQSWDGRSRVCASGYVERTELK